jgi:hypothetical protein
VRLLSVDLAPVSYGNNKYQKLFIGDAVENSIGTDANAVKLIISRKLN